MANNQQDVRVKISAEGIAEVVQAFQKVSDAAKKSGKEASEGFTELNKQFNELGKNLLGGLGLALLADKFKELFKSSLEGAESLTRLSAQTGISTNAIQALQRAARETGLSTEVANAGIVKFTAALGKAEIGSKQSANALADLGLRASEISKLSPDQRILAVSQALAGIADPARRARDEVALFGRAGVDMDQALIKVGKEGFEPFLAHLKELGLYLDNESIASLKGMAESLKDLGDQTKGLATQFLVGLVPSLKAATDELIRATSGGGANGFKSFGEVIGSGIRSAINWVIDLGHQMAAAAAVATFAADAIGKAFKGAVTGSFKDVGRALDTFKAQYAQLEKDVLEERAQREQRLNAPPPVSESKPGAAGGSTVGLTTQQQQALGQARYNLTVQLLDNELKLFQAHSKLQEDIDKNQYDRGLISLADYYSKRSAIISADFDKRIATAQAKARAQAALPISDDGTGVAQIQHQTQQAKLQGDIADLQEQRLEALKTNTNELAQAQEALDIKTIKAQETLLTLEGKKQQAAQLRLAADLKALDLELRQGGASDSDRTSALSGAAQSGQAKIDFDSTQQNAKAGLQSLMTAQKAIEDQVRDGQLFSIQAQQQIIALDRERLPALQAEAAELLKIAQASKDPTLISQAEAFKEKIDQIAVSTNQVGQQMAQLKQGVESAVGAGLNTFLNDALKGTKNLKTTFKDTALSIITDLEKIAEKAIEQEILKQIFGTAGGGGGAAGGGGFIASIAGLFAATGGEVRGPGSSTSDSIPAMLSDKEFVVNAKATQAPGVLPLLHAINGGGIRGPSGTGVPRYAEGGVVSQAPAMTYKSVNVLDPTVLGDHLQSQEGETSVLNIISRNPSHVRNAVR